MMMLNDIFELNKEIAEDACATLKAHGFSQNCFARMSQALDNLKDISKVNKNSSVEVGHDEILDAINDISKYYQSYMYAKKQYKAHRMDNYKREMLNHLARMFDAHTAAMREIKNCMDCDEERNLIAEKIN